MDDTLKTEITTSLRDRLTERHGPEVTVVAIDSVPLARFYGELMGSALQTDIYTTPIGRGDMVCWAVILNGQPFGVGAHLHGGRWIPLERAFGFLNHPGVLVDDLDATFDEVLVDLESNEL